MKDETYSGVWNLARWPMAAKEMLRDWEWPKQVSEIGVTSVGPRQAPSNADNDVVEENRRLRRG